MTARTLLLLAPAVAVALSLATVRGDDSPAAADELALPDGLIADGLPKIPASLAAAVSSWTELKGTHFTAWHPTRREMLVSSRVGGIAQIHSVGSPMAALVQVTHGRQSTPYAIFPKHRSDYAVLVRDPSGADAYNQLFRADLEAGKAARLTEGDKSRNWFGPWSNKGDVLAYTSLTPDAKTTSVCVVDPLVPKSAHVVVALDGPGWYPTDWSLDDKLLLLLETVSATESRLWTLDLETGNKTEVTPRDEKIGFGWAYFGRDGKSILLACDKGAEFQRPCRLDRETGAITPLGDAIKWHVERFALSRDRKTLAVVTDDDGTGRVHVLDADTGAEHAYPKLPPGHVTLVSFHDNGKDLAFELESARTPGEVWSLDLETGAVEKWCASDTSGVDVTRVSEPELIHWKGEGGLPLSGWLSKPSGKFTGKRPVLISFHEGPELQARPTFRGPHSFLVAELGLAVLEPNVRGSSGYGKTFLALDDGPKREDAIKDVGPLLDWIKTRDDLDADRVMFKGTRYGGFMSLACAIRYDARIRGSIDFCGWVDLVSYVEKTPEARQNVAREKYGDEQDPQVREALDKLSPVTNASKITKALFVEQGAKDPRVPIDEVRQIISAARKNDAKVWFLVSQNEASVSGLKINEYTFCSAVRFIRETLLGEPGKKE